MQQQEYIEQWSTMLRTLSKPATEIAELNAKTLSHIYEKSTASMQNLTGTKKPEDLISAQVKLIMDLNAGITDYLQEVLAILNDASADMSKFYTHAANQTMKATAATINAGKHTSEKTRE